MTRTAIQHLTDVDAAIIRPMSKADARSVIVALKTLAKADAGLAGLMSSQTPLQAFIVAALSLSPFLHQTAVTHPQTLSDVLACPLETYLERCIVTARNAWKGDGKPVSDSEIMTRLRRAKRDMAFAVALADLSRLFDARTVARWLSEFAEAAVSAAIDHLLSTEHLAGRLCIADWNRPAEQSGVVVLGMGKLGAFELNYSSDIDLVVFYDPQAKLVIDPETASETFGRLLRRLVRILQDRTGDGYVFRTDLRLRPDPGATPLAIPVDAAMVYYESRGQNWERAAFIKARPVAGDRDAGFAFLRGLTPFIFRKYLDYGAIADIHSIKRQIHAHRGYGGIAVKGHDVKLGRGGIREIEFFVQTQQLIAGGRMPDLRPRGTEAALKALAQAKWIDAQTATELVTAYWFLRDVEHRIQMVLDEQTHRLPTTNAELKRIAFMMGFASAAAFSTVLLRTLKTVERRYAHLFEREADLSASAGNLVFTGHIDDPETLKTLTGMGFARPVDISRILRIWQSGRYRAMQSAEARERLTELMPELLRVFGESRRGDDALVRFDHVIGGLPAGIQLFSLLGNNPRLLSLIVTIMASAPRLAEIVAAKPHVFDGLLDPRLLTQLPDRDDLSRRIQGFLFGVSHYEERLDRLRIIAAEQRFLIGIRLLTGAMSGAQAGVAFTDLADLMIMATLDAVTAEMVAGHGNFPGGRVAVIGMGKLGSRELTAGSDVDLILLYDHEEDATLSDGPKPLDATRYFTRLTQRLISALSAPTAEGILYAVDLRLRPSGNQGPVATRVNAFLRYQRDEAWTWEHMALTRARALCGDGKLMDEANAIFRDVLADRRDIVAIASDVASMRGLIDREKPPAGHWDLKLMPGGLVDLEFIAQFLALTATGRDRAAPMTGCPTMDILCDLGSGVMASSDLKTLMVALRLFTDLSQSLRLCIEGDFDSRTAPSGLIDLLCQAGRVDDMDSLEAEVKRLSASVRRIFQATVRPPA